MAMTTELKQDGKRRRDELSSEIEDIDAEVTRIDARKAALLASRATKVSLKADYLAEIPAPPVPL